LRAFVLDASITVGWMLDRPIPARASLARKLITTGEVPVVPMLWRHEVSNAVVMSERRGRLTPGQIETLTGELIRSTRGIRWYPGSQGSKKCDIKYVYWGVGVRGSKQWGWGNE
jgi:predicted nucleic acid-binding protein